MIDTFIELKEIQKEKKIVIDNIHYFKQTSVLNGYVVLREKKLSL